MALPDRTRIALVPATGDGEETITTWRAFKADHVELKPEDFAAIESALESGIAYQHNPGKGEPVFYIVRR